MKKLLALGFVAFAVVGFMATPIFAEALSDAQQNSLEMLLRSFGADDKAVRDFQGAVLGATTGPTDDYGADGTSSEGVYCPKLTSTMQRGARDASTGGQVTELQLFLSDYFNLNEEDIATGFFGRLSQKYVAKFQQEKGLPAFGIVGSLTRLAIARACGNGQTGTIGTTPNVNPTTPSTNPPGTTPVLGGGSSAGLAYSLVLKGGGGVGTDSFIEGADIGPFVLTVKNVSSTTRSVTFPNNCWYSYSISDQVNGGRVIFDLSSVQQCISASSQVSKTFSLKPGDSFYIDSIIHRYQTSHIPPGNYGLALRLNTSAGTETVAKFEFKVYGREPVTSKLSCSLVSNKSSYTLGEQVTVRWTTLGASYATWIKDTEKDNFFLGGDKLDVTGSATFTANVLGNPYLVMKVFDASGNTNTCRLVIPVTSVITPTTGPNGTKCGVQQYSVENQCTAGSYRGMYVKCQDGYEVRQGDSTSCKPASTWSEYAAAVCANRCSPVSNSLRVTAPNGGEQWEIGQLNTITWAPYSYGSSNQVDWVNPANQVQVWLQKPDGTTVGQVMDTGKASLHTYFNLNDYQTYASPGEYYVYAKNMTTGEADRSDRTFTLLPRGIDIKVNGSDGPITLTDNQPISVTFTTGTTFTSCTLHGVRATINGATGISLTSTALTTAFNGYAWAQVPGSSTAIYITCTKADGSTRGDSVGVNMASSGVQAFVRVVSPNGGEQLPHGQQKIITLKGQGMKSYSLALYRNDQWVRWLAKDVSVANSAIEDEFGYPWTPYLDEGETMADWFGSVYKIYATGLKFDGTGYVDDKSDAPFSFSGGTTTSGGELYAVGVYEAASAEHNFCYSKPGTVDVNLVQLYGTSKGTPITLSLSAYEPVKWNITVPTGVNLQRVILSGYSQQSATVIGASPSIERYLYLSEANVDRGSSGQGAFYDDRQAPTPAPYTIYNWAGQPDCLSTSGSVPVPNRWYYNGNANYFYAYQKGDSNYTNLVSKLQSITGLTLKSFQGAYSGSAFTVTVGTPQY